MLSGTVPVTPAASGDMLKKNHSSHQHHKKMRVREGESSHPAGEAGTLQGLLLPPLPRQQMLHAALLAAKWQRFPPSSLFQHGLPALLRAVIWHHSAQLGIISHQQHHSPQAAWTVPLCPKNQEDALEQAPARSSKHHLA